MSFPTRRPSRAFARTWYFVVALALGIGPDGVVVDAQQRRGNGSARPPTHAQTSGPSTAEIDAFGFRVVALYTDPRGSEVDGTFSDERLIEHAVEGIVMSDEVRSRFLAGLREGSASSGGLVRRLLVRGAADDTIRYRGAGVRDGARVARFRFLRASGAFQFVEFALESTQHGLRVVDVWQTGQWASRVIRTVAMSLLPVGDEHATPGGLGRTAAERLTLARQLRTIVERAGADDIEGVLRGYDGCDPQLRGNEVVVLLVVATLTRHSDHPRYVELLDSFAQAFPHSAWSAMLDIDRFALHEDYEREAGAIVRLQRSVGEDAYLRYLLATARWQQGELEVALAEAERAVAIEPTLPDAHVIRAQVAAEAGRFDRVTASIEALAPMELEPSGLHDEPAYAAYRSTPDYRRLFP